MKTTDQSVDQTVDQQLFCLFIRHSNIFQFPARLQFLRHVHGHEASSAESLGGDNTRVCLRLQQAVLRDPRADHRHGSIRVPVRETARPRETGHVHGRHRYCLRNNHHLHHYQYYHHYQQPNIVFRVRQISSLSCIYV